MVAASSVSSARISPSSSPRPIPARCGEATMRSSRSCVIQQRREIVGGQTGRGQRSRQRVQRRRPYGGGFVTQQRGQDRRHPGGRGPPLPHRRERHPYTLKPDLRRLDPAHRPFRNVMKLIFAPEHSTAQRISNPRHKSTSDQLGGQPLVPPGVPATSPLRHQWRLRGVLAIEPVRIAKSQDHALSAACQCAMSTLTKRHK